MVEPSEKAYVLCTNNLSAIIQKHLSQGCRYHFESSSDSTEYYNALLVVSHWAKLLVKHQNITMIHMICAILGCEINKILILSYPEDVLSKRW